MSGKAEAGEGETAEQRLKRLIQELPHIPSHGAPLLDEATSVLGTHNPFAKPVDPKESIVWLLDNTAYQLDENSAWQLDLVAAYFVRYSGKEETEIVEALARALGLTGDAGAKETISERLRPFLLQIQPARTVEVSVADGTLHRKLGPSDNSGISKDVITLPDGSWHDGQVMRSTATEVEKNVPADTTIATAKGFAIISDIDDSIKVTMTNAPLGILKTTFVDDPVPIQGMPEFYKSMSSKLNHPPFWYLSASPYNLYPFLHAFRDKYYPTGTILLRDSSWRSLAGLITSLTEDVKNYKVDNMKTLQKWWPRRKMICIGDSTQSDPEAYGEMYRSHPEWIKAIWIRKVEDIKEVGDIFTGRTQEERNRPERFEKAFEGVPSHVWHVFETPTELDEKLDEVIRTG